MGHKGSHQHSGALGLEGKQRLPTDIDAENMEQALQEAEELDFREKIGRHTEDAISALQDVATKGEPDSARVSAAKAILEYSHGKPASQTPTRGSSGGITINIIRMTTGEKEPHTIEGVKEDVEDAQEIAEAVDERIAHRLLFGHGEDT